jgi:photosystem II stability/assembly factor-like uncharacterized protein
MKQLNRQREGKEWWVFITLISLLMIAITTFSGVMTSEANGAESAIRFNDKLLDVHMLESGKAWAVGHVGFIVSSDNFGKDWKVLKSPTPRSLFSVFFVSDTTGWICGELGTLYKTEDGGETWEKEDSGTAEQHLMIIKFINENKGWAVGTRGMVITTDDGGKSWARMPFSEDVTFNDLCFLNNVLGWFATEFDFVYNTEDGGQNMTAQTQKGIGNLFGVYFRDANKGVAVGAEGEILYTEDGGKKWKPAENDQNNKKTLMKVVLFKNNRGIAIGLDGTILLTKDGGQTWQENKTANYNNWFSGISFLENGRVIVVGGGGTVITSKDYGVTWE